MDNHRISIPERLTLNKYVQRNEGKYRKEEKKSEGVREKKQGISPLIHLRDPCKGEKNCHFPRGRRQETRKGHNREENI